MKAYNLNTAQQHREAVTELYLHHCGLSEVPALVFQCPRLRHLEITANALWKIPPQLGVLKQLEVLNLSGNRIEQLPDTLGGLSSLIHLDVRDNKLETLPSSLLGLRSLEVLRLAGNQLSTLPGEIDRWQQLRLLDLSGNGLSQLPAALGRLANLRELYLNRNGLRHLPKSLQQLSGLERLEVADNRLRRLAESLFSNMVQLSRLELSGNRLKEVPPSVGQCRHLAHLAASRNKLGALPPSLGLLSWLRTLDLSNNKLGTLPGEMAGCAFLRRLDLSENAISSLPPSISQLHRLQHLSLSRNALRDLPGLPAGLLELNLAHNKFEYIPPAVLDLADLQELDLGYNLLSRLPTALSKLGALRQLRLTGNAIAGWRAPVLNLDRLEALYGLTGGREKRRLLQFLKACRRQGTSREIRQSLFDSYQGKAEALEGLSLPHLVEALRFPLKEVRLAARQHLIDRRGASLERMPLRAGAKVACIGKVHFEGEALRSHLSHQGLSLVASEKDATHVVIGDRPSAPVRLTAEQVFISEVQLNAFLDRSEERYLAGEEEAEKVARVRQLLLHDNPQNVRLAIQLMKGGGVPSSLLTELFYVWKMLKGGKLKREIRQLLELNLPESDRPVLSMRRSLSGSIPRMELEENIRRFTGATVLEEAKLRALSGLENGERIEGLKD